MDFMKHQFLFGEMRFLHAFYENQKIILLIHFGILSELMRIQVFRDGGGIVWAAWVEK